MKGLLYFLLGAGVGGLTGFLVTRRIDNKRNDEEIAQLEAYYKNKIVKKPVKEKKEPVKTEEKPSEEALKMAKDKPTIRDVISPIKGPITDYAAKYKSHITREEDDDPIPEGNKPYLDSDPEALMSNEIKGMVIISDVEWEEDDEYEKREITYFENDEIFADELGNEMDNMTPDDVGRPNLEKFGITGEEGVLYVRSEDTMTDYRINLEEGDFFTVEE